MSNLSSRITKVLRKVAAILPTNNKVRRFFSAGWDSILRIQGDHTDVTFGEQTVRLQIAYRRLDPNYEKLCVTLWCRLLNPGDVVWDVGCNFGLYTILSGKCVGPDGHVVSWEPSPTAHATAMDHVKANGLSNWCDVRQAAISDRPGVMPFSMTASSSNDPANRLGGGKMNVTIDVPVESLDGVWLGGMTPPQHLKVDVEGAEVLVFRGATQMFASGGPRPNVLLEVHPMFLPEFQCDAQDIANFVFRHDYVSFRMNGDSAEPTLYDVYLLVPIERRDEVCRKLGWSS